MNKPRALTLLVFAAAAVSVTSFAACTTTSINNAANTEDAGVTPDAAPELDAGEDPDADAESGLPPAAAVDTLTNESADDYAHNRWGLIEADTLKTYATTWATADTAAATAAPNGRPAHLSADARLVVLQLNGANRAAGENFVPSNPSGNVHVYELDAFRFNETRDTGLVSNSVRYQASGPTTDDWLSRYGIDPSRDFLVFAAGENAAANGAFFQELARATYWLSYWGVELDHLAIVNGSLQKNYTGALGSNKTPESSISNDGFSVKSLRRDHTALTLPLEDFLAIVDGQLSAPNVVGGFDKQFIIDARPTGQFDRTTTTASFFSTHPGQFITTAWSSTGAPSEDATGQGKSYVLYEGHVKGAVSFPWASLVEDAGGANWKYKSKAQLAQIFTDAGYAPADRATKVVVSQCRTNFEVQVNGFASRVILGYPTVHFDGSLVEYFSLVSEHPDAAKNLAPADPAYKYRTDTATRSQRYEASATAGQPPTTTESDTGVTAYNVASGTTATDRKVDQAVIDRNATTTRKALDEDREYKRR
ncbi:MAG: hypothetical protein KIT84_27335 [Labilithrix sp.]|nr:hypothetical protein [Labilithrix sp.]MCW5814771.1 hypothetical protein [Labilithrix sp.]